MGCAVSQLKDESTHVLLGSTDDVGLERDRSGTGGRTEERADDVGDPMLDDGELLVRADVDELERLVAALRLRPQDPTRQRRWRSWRMQVRRRHREVFDRVHDQRQRRQLADAHGRVVDLDLVVVEINRRRRRMMMPRRRGHGRRRPMPDDLELLVAPQPPVLVRRRQIDHALRHRRQRRARPAARRPRHVASVARRRPLRRRIRRRRASRRMLMLHRLRRRQLRRPRARPVHDRYPPKAPDRSRRVRQPALRPVRILRRRRPEDARQIDVRLRPGMRHRLHPRHAERWQRQERVVVACGLQRWHRRDGARRPMRRIGPRRRRRWPEHVRARGRAHRWIRRQVELEPLRRRTARPPVAHRRPRVRHAHRRRPELRMPAC